MSASSPSHVDPPPGPQGSAQWFIGRDGQQFGPVTEAEFRKLIELGHLRSSDLVWREGWADWRPAHVLLPDPSQQPRHPAPPVQPTGLPSRSPVGGGEGQGLGATAPVQRPREPQDVGRSAPKSTSVRPLDTEDENGAFEDGAASGGRRGLKVAIAVLFFVAALCAAGWMYLPQLTRSFKSVAGAISVNAPSVAAGAPIAGFQAEPDATDRMLQSTTLFKTLKRTHPEWYGQRVAEASQQMKSGSTDMQVLSSMMQAVVKLRRQHAENASAAPLGHLVAIGQSFVGNLGLLKTLSADTCFAFISNGETASGVVELFQHKDHSALLQQQLVAVFEAVEEGRKTPRVYPQPKQGDYDLLVAELQGRGWSQADIQTFSDSRALAKSPPDKVCMLVTQWFESQLSLKDSDVKLRLLVDSLRPMIAG